MDEIVGSLVAVIVQGGPEIVAILLLFIFLLLIERKRLLKEIQKRDERINKLIDDYHAGYVHVAEVLVALRLMVYEVKSRI